MQKSEIKILIVEDDLTLGKAVEVGFRRSGYNTVLTTNAAQALNAAEMSEFHGIVMDCMLPRTNGLEVAIKLMGKLESEPTLVFTSGIYKDKLFIHDAIMKTHAKAFLTKPFDIQELIKLFDQSFQKMLDVVQAPIYEFLIREQYSHRDKIQAINKMEFVNGCDLPYIYSLLVDNQISGTLHLNSDDKSPATIIGFNRGRIDKVLYHDKASYFGVLLVEKGFTTPEELKQGLEQQEKTPIGQFMVDHSYISPHAIEIVQHEQMIIRISKTIQETSLKIRFVEEEKQEPKIFIDTYQMPTLLSDWINTKLTLPWLRNFYLTWLDHPILKGVDIGKVDLLGNISAGRVFANFLTKYEWPHTLQDLITQNPNQEYALLKGIHFYLLQRVIVFGPKNESQGNINAKTAKFKKVLSNFEGKNHFEILGLSRNARPSEIQRAYHDLAKNFHPDKLGPNSTEELKAICQNIFAIITEAFHVLNNEKRRADYNRSLEIGLAEEILRAESNFEMGIKLMRNNQFREARKIFERVLKMKGHRTDTIIYVVWTLIKEKRHRTDRKSLALKARELMHRVAHEDRHSPPYFFIKGMTYELTGQIQKAYQHFKHCQLIDPHFTDARKEMAYIKHHYVENRPTGLTSELSTVVTKLFKRKSG